MLVHIKKIVPRARKKSLAIGAFNTSNLEVTLAIIRAASLQKSSVIIQSSESTIKYAGLKTLVAMVKSISETDGKNVAIALHLDHGKDFDLIKECIAYGFSSVQFDGSEIPFEKNIELTAKIADYAHDRGVWIQGELGAMAGKEGISANNLPGDLKSLMTNPAEVKEFVKKTKVDTLAVSVGTIHGCFKGIEKIDYERIRQINKMANKPLVLHGASGNNPQSLKKAIDSGISIINIDTDIRIAFTKSLQTTLSNKINYYDPRKILTPSIESMIKEVSNKIKILGSDKI